MLFKYRSALFKYPFLFYIVLSTLFVRLPYWLLSSIRPSWRPRPSWDLRHVLTVRMFQVAIRTLFEVGLFPPPDESKKAGSEYVVVPAVPPELVAGEVKGYAEMNSVSPTDVGGFWYGQRNDQGAAGQKAGEGETVIYHLHGGGYIMGGAGPGEMAIPDICNGLIDHISCVKRVFALEYRLSSSAPFKAANPFPASLLDAVAGYRYLVGLGFLPENIIVAGDSAGGNLAIALTRYLVTSAGPMLNPPGRLILLSPTVEWIITHDGPGSSFERNATSDFCQPFFKGYTARALAGNMSLEDAMSNSWISPGSRRVEHNDGIYSGFPVTCIHAGEAEFQLDSMATFRKRLEENIEEGKVKYIETFGGTHDFIGFTTFEPERTEALKEIAAWVEATRT
ncbi:Alpha/Beta hydrolase protein [Vararia minispora EC-137]|uniref:Alpha/Beta hydrolase protein n=1 Tax=Vararia minispora EC-137 TaxID=1314806 RepID=A0ACB8QZ86_9AGAM|nr:Alpha/Beta hydrolase protein [Vararia minispora EC-137]